MKNPRGSVTGRVRATAIAAALLLAAGTAVANGQGSDRRGNRREGQRSPESRGSDQGRPTNPDRGRGMSPQERSQPRPSQPDMRQRSPAKRDQRAPVNVPRGDSRPEYVPKPRPEPSRGGAPVRSEADGRGSPRPSGPGSVQRTRSGAEVRYGNGGKVSSIRRNGVTVVHGPGQRMIVHRPDGRTVVTNRAGHGFVQRGFSYGGQQYVARTYYVRGQVYAHYYRPYRYHGIELHRYVPVRYYAPAFYGWTYRPWHSRVYFRWGWMSAPWYGWYGSYFRPAPYYASPAYWLVDYLISAQLALAYDERRQQEAYGAAPVTPEVRAAIADEVARQLALEGREAQSLGRGQVAGGGEMAPDWLDGASHVFVASYNLDVQDSQGRVCSLGRGDVLQLTGPVPPDATSAWVRVLATAGGGCGLGATVAVGLDDLEDMSNQMRESVSQGLGELYSRAGQSGIPALPAGASGQPAMAAFVESAPPPDENVGAELSRQVQEADQMERDTLAETKEDGGPATLSRGQVELRPGQTVDEVRAILGEPTSVVILGDKEIHTYPDVKVTFVRGRVQDIQ